MKDKILLATNYPLSQTRVLEALSCSYPVETANDDVSVCRAINCSLKNFICVVIDINLPRYGGIAILDEIRQIDTEIPVIIISGGNDGSRVVECLEHGADDFIVFPVSVALLKARLDVILRRIIH